MQDKKRRRFRLAARVTGFLGLTLCLGGVHAEETLILEGAQTAVLDPAHWNKVFADERYFDAVRPLLIRFPGAAEAIHARLKAGERIERMSLVLEWERQEGPRPERGRHGWGADEQYARDPGQWHVVAYALLRPWTLHEDFPGPTFNAYLNGLAYWDRGGGRAPGTDRHPRMVGPLPLFPERAKETPTTRDAPTPEPDDLLLDLPGSDQTPEQLLDDPRNRPPPTARLDFTWTLEDAAFGETLAERLHHIETQGFQVHKHEIRDMKYRRFYAYDWAVSIAYMRIWIRPPRLEVTFQPGANEEPVGELPSGEIWTALIDTLNADRDRGIPSIAVPADWAEHAATQRETGPELPDWQRQRIRELQELSRAPNDVTLRWHGVNWGVMLGDDREAFQQAVQELLKLPPRTWIGHLSSDFALLPTAIPDLLPPGVMDHLKLYWEAWLHPETRRVADLGGGRQRGGPSYFRGYSNGGGTMNFGHNAVMGALLGAQLINAEYPLADAQRGVRNLLYGGHGLGSGAHQEIGDTYYQALTIAAAGAMAHYAENPSVQMMARFHRDFLVEPLVSMYHPGLRRMTHPMGRGSYFLKMLMQEGPYHVLHTLSPQGVLMHLDDLKPLAERQGPPTNWGSVRHLSILGNEGPPDRMAVISPWTDNMLADAWSQVVDAKPFPWRIHARDFSPGCRGGGWHVNYLSEYYALASRDNANYDYGVTSVVAQWRRREERVQKLDDLSTMIMGFGSNNRFMQPGTSMGEFSVLQHDNKMISMKYLPPADEIPRNKFGDLHALHTSIALFATGDVSEREVWINDRRIDALSGPQPEFSDDWRERLALGDGAVIARDSDRIFIRDGVTWLGLIPIVAHPQHRRREVAIALDHPVLLVHAYMYDEAYAAPDAPSLPSAEIGADVTDDDMVAEFIDELNAQDDHQKTTGGKLLTPAELAALKKQPMAGFVIEMGDATQYSSFQEFRQHMMATSLQTAWDEDKGRLQIRYRSGADQLDMDVAPGRYPVPMRRINGAWPYLPPGIIRASDWAIQGSTGEIERQGAVLHSKPGQHAYLMTVPAHDMYVGYAPGPAPTPFALITPGNREVRADGEVGLMRVAVQPNRNRVWIDNVKASEPADGAATSLLLFGFDPEPDVILNGQPLENLAPVQAGERRGVSVPLNF